VAAYSFRSVLRLPFLLLFVSPVVFRVSSAPTIHSCCCDRSTPARHGRSNVNPRFSNSFSGLCFLCTARMASLTTPAVAALWCFSWLFVSPVHSGRRSPTPLSTSSHLFIDAFINSFSTNTWLPLIVVVASVGLPVVVDTYCSVPCCGPHKFNVASLYRRDSRDGIHTTHRQSCRSCCCRSSQLLLLSFFVPHSSWYPSAVPLLQSSLDASCGTFLLSITVDRHSCSCINPDTSWPSLSISLSTGAASISLRLHRSICLTPMVPSSSCVSWTLSLLLTLVANSLSSHLLGRDGSSSLSLGYDSCYHYRCGSPLLLVQPCYRSSRLLRALSQISAYPHRWDHSSQLQLALDLLDRGLHRSTKLRHGASCCSGAPSVLCRIARPLGLALSKAH
jgi:hypothetical protein